MYKKTIALGLLFGLVGFAAFTAGCGQQTTTATTPTPIAAGSAVAISGTTAVGVTALGLRTFSTALGTAEVRIGYCAAGSDGVTELGRGTTSSDGTYEVLVSVASLESLKATGGYVPNLMVEISKEGVVVGCVIPSVSPEAGSRGYAPTASKGDYKKALIARSAFKKGKDPKSFDYSGSIDTKFSSESLKDYTPDMVNDMADSIKSGEDAEEGIGLALGISVANMEAMKMKGFELHRIYIEPIMQAAFTSKTPPNRDQMDTAFASMEAAMSQYARDLGISDQAISDFKSMKDKTMETKMGESTLLKNDGSFQQAKLRMSGNKMINMFLGQWTAANTIATTAPSGKTTFAASNDATYISFVASKESIKVHLLTLLGTPGTDPGTIPDYLRTAFFDAFIFPPANAAKPSPPPSPATPQEIAAAEASMEAFMQPYLGTRIMMYFMQTTLAQADRQLFFGTTQPAMQAVFQTRFNDTSNSSGYYMGPGYWATGPSADDVNIRLGKFNDALTAAIVNTTTQGIMTRAGFDSTQSTAVLNAFRILMAPPDAM